MGGVDCHEFPPGYGHPIQCDTIEDVKRKGRLDKMYDPSADVESMERLKAHLEKFAVKYRYHKDMNVKHAAQLKALQRKIATLVRGSTSFDVEEF